MRLGTRKNIDMNATLSSSHPTFRTEPKTRDPKASAPPVGEASHQSSPVQAGGNVVESAALSLFLYREPLILVAFAHGQSPQEMGWCVQMALDTGRSWAAVTEPLTAKSSSCTHRGSERSPGDLCLAKPDVHVPMRSLSGWYSHPWFV